MWLSRNKKNNVYPCKPQFYCIKMGFKGVKIIKACFRDDKTLLVVFLCMICLLVTCWTICIQQVFLGFLHKIHNNALPVIVLIIRPMQLQDALTRRSKLSFGFPLTIPFWNSLPPSAV